MKVVKFGGSSVASAEQLVKVGDIIKEDDSRKFIVVSAPGKRTKEDIKITDLLIELGNTYIHKMDYKKVKQIILQRFNDIIENLALQLSLLDEIEESIDKGLIDLEYNLENIDCLKAIGEDSSAKILSAYLQKLGLNARYLNPKQAGIIVSNEPGNAHILPDSYKKIQTLREKEGIMVIPGFFGYTEEDELMTFSRGGSDITGSIIAAGVKASLYENFTDVDSVYKVNPTIVDNPKEIRTLTYKEMRELSYAGFSVFHDEALIPAFNAQIPVCIKNTNNPSKPGTMIVSEKKQDEKCVVGIASDIGFTSIYISKYLMNREVGFGRKLFQILEEEGVSFEHAPSGIDDMSIIIRESRLGSDKEEIILKRFKEELQPDQVDIHRDLAIVMVVGEGLVSTIGVAQKATTAFAEANVNIEMINQGSSEVSMMFGIKKEDLSKAVRSLYYHFFE
ncbi:aspartate kinase [Virgibacillus halodenitrificans]|uniref:Aspartokinase n=1 Tax=Virgibacillus halodenitrificans TaxID=1482 RepID=A0AAC9IZA3_VIRHA|nr:aspartate kinase [Virgibacillus halodenitrificans]APC48347.1 aspartate kinase [Virgibacillus halodenitrificans]MBD1222703.1 aspartate kinase [Virgibacillus halodenitrificans]MCG1029871.1 aspartate kinase [Virgibacillus halodenitrificans]MCJ0930913.1 aspartate kinase [Virgibacillus halodenitrificans]MEC2158384.1 aspartate kinase [Virgibacillus halodenitrificans]